MKRTIDILSGFAWIACFIEAILLLIWRTNSDASQYFILKIVMFILGFFALPAFLKGASIARHKDRINPILWFALYAVEIIIYVSFCIVLVF